MKKRVTIYKHDKWNMLTVEVDGKKLLVSRISQEWGEDCFKFLSRAEMLNWVEQTFKPDTFEGTQEELTQILEAFRSI